MSPRAWNCSLEQLPFPGAPAWGNERQQCEAANQKADGLAYRFHYDPASHATNMRVARHFGWRANGSNTSGGAKPRPVDAVDPSQPARESQTPRADGDDAGLARGSKGDGILEGHVIFFIL